MPTQLIPNATIQDVEAAMIDQYGRQNVRQKVMTESQAQWLFKITSKSHGKCSVTKTPTGVTVTMGAATHILLWIITGLGYLFLIFPGVILTAFLLITRFITGRVIAHRFPKMTESIQRAADNRRKGVVAPSKQGA